MLFKRTSLCRIGSFLVLLYVAATCVGCAVLNAVMFHPPRTPYGTDLPGENDGRVTVASASAGSPSEVLILSTGHAWMMRNPAVISNTIAFLAGTNSTR